MIKTIVIDKDILKQKSELVSSPAEAKEIITQLKETLKAKANGAGLAAIQIGIPKRVAILNCNGFVELINPEIIEAKEEFIFNEEGCLSFPGLVLKTKRFKHFTIKNKRVENNEFQEETLYFYFDEYNKGMALESIACQHEIDHMDGITILDRKTDVKEIGRNDPCPCGKIDNNGKPVKYKKCCLKN